jgi:hypothetical protein
MLAFADKIEYNAPVYLLLSGRNKPSLILFLKYWTFFPDDVLILNGKGSFPKNTEQSNIMKKQCWKAS